MAAVAVVAIVTVVDEVVIVVADAMADVTEVSAMAIVRRPEAKTVKAVADEIGYPVLLKAAAGGGGKGMRAVDDPEELERAFEAAAREALSAFGDGSVDAVTLRPAAGFHRNDPRAGR